MPARIGLGWVRITFTQAMTLDASGNLGVGTASPAYRLQVETASATGDVVGYFRQGSGAVAAILSATDLVGFGNGATSGETRIYADGASGLVTFRTAATERARITAAGDFLVGTTSVQTFVSGTETTLTIKGNSANKAASLSVVNASGDCIGGFGVGESTDAVYTGTVTNHPVVFLANNTERARITAAGELCVATSTPIFNSSNRGNITIGGSASSLLFLGTGTTTGTYIYHDQSNSNVEFWNNANGAIIFGTNNAERARITSGGNFLVGTTSSSSAADPGVKIISEFNGANSPGLAIVTSQSTNSTASLLLYSTGAGAYRFYVADGGTIYATNTSITGISDQRYKEGKDRRTGV
jgi:hypothetical protein